MQLCITLLLIQVIHLEEVLVIAVVEVVGETAVVEATVNCSLLSTEF